MKYTVEELKQLFLSEGTTDSIANTYHEDLSDDAGNDGETKYYYLYIKNDMSHFKPVFIPRYKLSEDGTSVDVYTYDCIHILRYNPEHDKLQCLVNTYDEYEEIPGDEDNEIVYTFNDWDDFIIGENDLIFMDQSDDYYTNYYVYYNNAFKEEVESCKKLYYKALLADKAEWWINVTLSAYLKKCKKLQKYYESEVSRITEIMNDIKKL